MVLSSEYQVIDTIYENKLVVIYRALRFNDKKKVILKSLKSLSHSESQIAEFSNEKIILTRLNSKNIIKLIDTISTPSEYVHVYEDIDGISLRDLLKTKQFNISQILDIAYTIMQTIEYIHSKDIIHTQINLNNIIYNYKTHRLQIVDFLGSFDKNITKSFSSLDHIMIDDIVYMSPEQTGRTKKEIDYRTDFYSFGMTMYYFLLGHIPVFNEDKAKLIHKQIVINPTPLHDLSNDIPLVLSKIVEKLIQKDPANRYQNSNSILYDLEESKNRITSDETIENFTIATKEDHTLDIGNHFFGRKNELTTLREASNYIKDKEQIKILISGDSGVGKTRLIEEFFTYLDRDNIQILRGKFDQFKTFIPYLAFKQIFTQLHTLLMSKVNSTYSISSNSEQVLNEIFPELKSLFSYKKSVSSSLRENVFNQLPFAVTEFLDVVSNHISPLIIFIDDLQWADEASVTLMEKVLFNSNKNLHFIGSFRNNAIESNKYAIDLIDKFSTKDKYHFFDIKLFPLEKSILLNILQEIFHNSHIDLKPLNEIIYTKTNGNPFYVKSFISYLIDKEEFTFKDGIWNYSIESIEKYSSSTNIATIINNKFNNLRNKEQAYLQYLSLLESSFDMKVTFEMMNSFGYSNKLMSIVVSYGFIQKYASSYKFTHDQIQKHIVNSLDDALKRRIHFHIGHHLERIYLAGENIDFISIVNHLNSAYLSNKYPKKLFKLNVKAVDELLFNGYYSSALEKVKWVESSFYLNDFIKKERTILFHFFLLKTRALYLNSFLEEAYIDINKLIKFARNMDEKKVCFSLLKNICVTSGKKFDEALDFGNILFKEYGLTVPSSGENIMQEIDTLNNKISTDNLSIKVHDIIYAKELQKDREKTIMALLVDYWEIAYYKADITLMKWTYLTIVEYSFRYGNCNSSTFGYVLYGAQLISEKSYKKGYLFGEIALKLNHLQHDNIMLPKIHNFVANFINPYVKPLNINVSLYQKSLYQSKKNGDIVFGTWANFLMHFSDYLAGTPLPILLERINKESSFILNSGDDKMIAIFKVLINSIEKLQGNDKDISKYEEYSIKMWQLENFYPALAWYAIIKAQSCFLYASFNEGLSYLEKYLHLQENEVIMFPKIRLHFIRALLLFGKKETLSSVENKTLQSDLDEFRTYVKASPRNFKFEKLLLKAEEIKHNSSPWDIAKLYDTAIDEAEKLDNSFFIALGELCVSRFWTDIYYKDMSRFYFAKSIVGLKQWGANGVVDYLKEDKETSENYLNKTDNDFYSIKLENLEQISNKSLLSSFNAISQSQDNKTLISTLMKIIIEDATASRIVLIFKENDLFKIKAGYDFEEDKIEFFDNVVEKSSLVPKNLIMYSVNTKQSVTVSNPSENEKFEFDEYIREKKPASCFVIPSMIEGKINGVLYIENREVVTPLSLNNTKVLELLLTQATIVYKNTSLYETLKSNEDKLNKAQQISHVGSWQYSAQDNSIVWSEETYRIYELEPFSIEIDNDWFINHLYPEDVDYILNSVEKALDFGVPYDVTHRIITATGKDKIVHQLAETHVNGDIKYMSGTIQDVTQSKHDEDIISRLSQVVNQNPFTTIITNKIGVIEYVNTQCEIMTGYSQKELIGKSMNIFRSGTYSKEFYADLWNTVSIDKNIWRGTIVNKMKNGMHLDCMSTVFPILNKNSDIINFVTIQEDVTEQNVKDKLFLMQTRQAQMGEMLSMIAHQWRQPLSIISSLINKERVNIALDQLEIDNILHSFNSVETQVLHLSQTISDFKDFFKPDKEAVNTKSYIIINDSLKLVEHSLKLKNIEVIVTHNYEIEYKTFKHEVVQVIINLLKNSQDAFSDQSVLKPYIKITTDVKDGSAIIHVEDNANGIDKSVLDTLFLPYVSTKDKKNGTGLGLYMSKTIIEQHCKGSLSVENVQNGAKFTIQIPLKGSL